MRLEFVYLPVPELQPALELYRDKLGFDELWREGELTVGLAIPGTETALMVDAAAPPGSPPGPILGVESVDAWLDGRELEMTMPPSDIPGGRLAAFSDPGGNTVYVMDQSAS
jgi:hypothetical protein